MLTEDDSIFWGKTRVSVHLLLCHRIELLKLASFPVIPIWEAYQFATCEATDSLLFRGAMACCVEGTHGENRTIIGIQCVIVCGSTEDRIDYA